MPTPEKTGGENIQLARDSLARCVKEPGFIDRFYDLFVSSSPGVAAKFAATDFERQKRVLQDSLFMMLVAAGTTEGFARAELERLARRHSRTDLDIHPDFYSLWLSCLMKAVEEFDPEFSQDIENAWRQALREPIELMKSRY